MIKRLFLAIMIALPISMFAQKFGVIDADAIMQALPEFATMQAQIEEASKKYQAEFDKLGEELNKKFAEYQALEQDPTASQVIKEQRMQDIQNLDNRMQQFRNTAAQDLQRQQQQLAAPIQQKVSDAIKTVGQEGNFTFIFPLGLAYYEGSNVEDITAAVKAKLGLK